MTNHEQDHDDDVEEYEYQCFDTCERYPEGCKDCDQVMHEGIGQGDKQPPKKQ